MNLTEQRIQVIEKKIDELKQTEKSAVEKEVWEKTAERLLAISGLLDDQTWDEILAEMILDKEWIVTARGCPVFRKFFGMYKDLQQLRRLL